MLITTSSQTLHDEVVEVVEVEVELHLDEPITEEYSVVME
jgi:hypothetical protein